MSKPNSLQLAILLEGGLAVIAVGLAAVLVRWQGLPLWQRIVPSVELVPETLLRGLLATIPPLVLFAGLQRSSWEPVVTLRRRMTGAIRVLLGKAGVGELAAISALAGVGEELLFRGVLQPAIANWSTPSIGLIGASLLFGLAHYLSFLYFALATLVGCYFGLLADWKNDVLAPALAHGLYDFLALVWILRVPSKTARLRPNAEEVQ